MREDVTLEESNKVRYGLMQFVNDKSIYVMDKFAIDQMFNLISAPSEIFAYFLSFMILTLAFFMMTVSYTQKIRDLAWEQGVLRAIGLTKEQNSRLFYYEAICVVIASFITGVIAGLIASVLIAGLFGLVTETPRNMIVPYVEMLLVIVIISVATYLAVRVPARNINKSQISSVLKGS